jgi:hypothetical protein
VRSVNPAPDVCTVSSEETMVVALIVDGAERESILGWDIRPQIRAKSSSPGSGGFAASRRMSSGHQ